MEIILTKKINLEPIGDIAFVWDNKSRRKGKRILIRDIHILHETMLSIDADSEKALMKWMKQRKTDLLTDGQKFYTTFGSVIKEIKHPQFQLELEFHNLIEETLDNLSNKNLEI